MHAKNMIAGFSGTVVVLSLFMLITASTADAGTSLPVFADHPVTERFTGTPAMPDLASAPDAKQFATRINEGAKKGPNFAGHYTIIEWGCGSECQRSAIVDAKTGAVYFPDFTSSWGMLYRPDSSLLIVNPIDPRAVADDRVPAWMATEFYQWDGRKLIKLAESKDLIIDPQTGAASKPKPKLLTVIDYYNMNKHDNLKIEKRDGVWNGQGDSGWHPLKVEDIANGYVEYGDPGYNNGAGYATYSGALFLTNDKQPMFALLQTITSIEQKCPKTTYTLETYRMQGDQMVEATDVMPQLPLSLFMKKGTSTEKSETAYAIGFRLPRKGTTVEAFLDTSSPYCVRELLKNARLEPVKLKWNKATGRFEIQADR
jgi:hypothetical protein